jgi:GAF domain-containing protein/HAMP domain-containing protein
MNDAARSASRMGWLPLGPLGARRRRLSGQERTRGRLFRKYVLLIVGLVSLVLLLNSALDFWFSYEENKTALFRIQQEKAGSAAHRIEQFVDEIERQLGWTTAPQWAASPLEQRRFDYVRLLRQVPAITELIQLDDIGKEQLKVSRLAMDVVGSEKDYSGSPSFIEARQHRVWFSPVYFRKESEPYMTVALARAGRNAGVTVAEVNLKLIWDVITGLKIGQSGYAYVVDRDGRLIAHPDISLVLRNTDLSQLPQVAAARAETPSLPSPASGGGLGWGRPTDQAGMVAKGIDSKPVLTAHAAISPLGWTVFVELPLSEALAPLYGSMLRTAALLALALVLATLAALMLARRMTVPIRKLQAGAARIGAGELDRQIDIHTGDELEDLAGDFNRMASDLQKSYADLEKKVEDRTAELKEALDQQTATAEVLGVINSSPGDLAPVFDAMLEKAMRLCEAAFGMLLTFDGERFQVAAHRGLPIRFIEYMATTPAQPGPSGGQARVLRGEKIVHFADMRDDQAYRDGTNPNHRAMVDLGGARTGLVVPLRKDDAVVGTFTIYRQEVRLFSDKQIALLQNFAAQAVIAMENARLITETREALEQQTATAEVLQVINSSPGDLAPVFDAMLEKAHTLCGAAHGSLQLYDGENLHAVATHAVSDKFADILRQGYRAADSPASQALIEGKPFAHIADCAEIDHPVFRGAAELAGIHTVLFVPLRKDGAFLGLISAARLEVRPFSEKEIALLQNFAAQAVIAMENARLITETREALDQQTATAELLGVINSSPGELAPVFDAMLEKAVRLCDGSNGILWTFDGERPRLAAFRNMSPEIVGLLRHQGESGTHPLVQRVIAGDHLFQFDLAEHDAYRSGKVEAAADVVASGVRTIIWVALVKDGTAVGAFVISRQEVRPFTDKQIALLQNFAAQAVIAMENARLIIETREALEQQTATAEVLQVINSSPGDLVPVFEAMLDKAIRLSEATHSHLFTYDGDLFHLAAARGEPRYIVWQRQAGPVQPYPSSSLAQIKRGQRIVHVADIREEEVYRALPIFRESADLRGVRSQITVALIKDNTLLGAMIVYRQEVRPFTEKQIALLQNFAAQAVIAMENARLLTETREALEQQTATAEVLQVINSSPGDLTPVFDVILEKAHTLCGAAHGGLNIYDGERFRNVAAHAIPPRFAELMRQPFHARPIQQRLLQGERYVHVPDMLSRVRVDPDDPIGRASDEAGIRTLLVVPLRKDNALLGYITAHREEVRPFTDKQISLLENFAAQAVIAMENARLLTETREALEQQTATAEVLQVINSSPGDLAPVFDAMVERAARLCEADEAALRTFDGELLHLVAVRGSEPDVVRRLRQLGPTRAFGLYEPFARGARVMHIADVRETDIFRENPVVRERLELRGIRTWLAVALHKEGILLGVINVHRHTTRRFTDKQIALLENFAAQAVIAMDNVRLITELRQRTRDLQESLEYQTATSDVLKVISQSGAELDAVLGTLVETAARICEADKAVLQQLSGGLFRMGASFGFTNEYREYRARNPIRLDRGTAVGRMAVEQNVIHIEDALNDPEYDDLEAQRLGEFRTMLAVPLLREQTVIGGLFLARSRVERFTEKQIALVRTFADQAVIAIENARLLNDLRSRTRDLQESLEYQTATSDVLKVISQSTFDLEPVLQTVLDTAMRLCGNSQGEIFRLEDGAYRMAVGYGMEPDYHDIEARLAIPPGPDTLVGRTALAGQPVQIIDALADPDYAPKDDAQIGRLRSMLGVPLLREGVPIGVICTARTTVEPFTEKQIALVRTFADQAVIAIENARLFNELRARTEELGSSVAELKMLSEVGQAVSSTLDLRTVLSTILNASLGVTWANAGAVFRYSRAERAFRLVEAVGWDETLAHSVRELHVAETESAMGEAVARRMPIQLPDLAQRASYPLRDITLAAGFHSALIVPLVGAERILGAILLMRQEAGEFPAETVRLMQTLASQSVLAIQNARLFREIADKSEQLALASQHKSQFLANMSHELRTPLNAILGYAELLVDGIYGVLPDRPRGVLDRIQNNGKHLLALINDVLDLAKIEAGQLTLTLEDYSVPEVVKSVVTATEPLATSKGLKFTAALPDDLPKAHGDARRVSQVLLNLVGNAIKFTDTGEVEIRAGLDKGQFVLTVRDTGPGIADADQERIFGEFQQIDNSNTRKKGGTGLGLAISRRMVEMQGGTISVDSVLGQGSTFRVVLPVHVDEMMEEAA